MLLFAEDFSYTIQSSTQHPYIKEAVVIDIHLKQTNPDVVLLFNFDIVKNPAYHFQRIDVITKETYHDLQISYRYLLYPLQQGTLTVPFNLLKKVTTDARIAYSFSGDRDNVKTLQTQDSNVTLPPLTLHVKALPKGTSLVGDFKLNYHIPLHQAKAHEPLPLHIDIEGTGYTPTIEPLLPKQDAVTHFNAPPKITSHIKKNEIYTKVNYTVALSSTDNFSLPPITYQAFNPKTQTPYTLTIPSQHFTVTPVPLPTLIDSKDTPKRLEDNIQWSHELLYYPIIFIAGFLTALAWHWRREQRQKLTPKPQSNHLQLLAKITHTKDSKALLQLLLAHPHPKLDTIVQKLETLLYSKTSTDSTHFKEIKKEAQQILEKKHV